MNNQLNLLLTKIETDFDELGSAIEHIKNADKISSTVLGEIKKISAKYIDSVKKIEVILSDYLETFTESTRKEFKHELKKLDDKSKSLQIKIDELEKVIKELKAIDFEQYFTEYKQFLADLSPLIKEVLIRLKDVDQIVGNFSPLLTSLRNDLENKHTENKKSLQNFRDANAVLFSETNQETQINHELVLNQLYILTNQNTGLKKELKEIKIIQFIALVFIFLFIAYTFMKTMHLF